MKVYQKSEKWKLKLVLLHRFTRQLQVLRLSQDTKHNSIRPQFPKKASTLALVALDKNFIQIGALTPARASIEAGRVHIPSPHIKPEATAGPKASALALFNFSYTNNIRLPTHMSMAK